MAKSAIEQARDTFDKLVNMKIDRPPLPEAENRVYPIATLPQGGMLLSDGSQRVSFPAKKILKKKQTNKMKVDPEINQQDNLLDQASNLTLSMAVPEQQLGEAEGAMAFANFLQQVLRPQIQGAPELGGVSTILPGLTEKQPKFQPVQALANLPSLRLGVKDLFGQASDMRGQAQRMAMRERSKRLEGLLGRYNNRRRGVRRAPSSNRVRPMPLSADYRARFGLPAQQTAGYASIGPKTVSEFTQRI